MFSEIVSFFTGVEVKEENSKTIRIVGMKTAEFISAVTNLWKTSKITANMFRKVKSRQLDIHPFFAPDLYYVCKRLLGERRTRINRNAVGQVISQLETNTWMKSAFSETFTQRLNLKALSRLSVELLAHQNQFLARYNEMVARWFLKGYILGAAPGSGKALEKNTPVKVPGGWKAIGDLKIGNAVASRDGSYCRVTGVFPQGEKQLYRITLSDGRSLECCAEHLWQYHEHNTEKSGYWKVDNTEKLIELLKKSGSRIYIPLPEAVEDAEVEHIIDPYAIGVFIGDGTLSTRSIGWNKPDNDVVDEMQKLIPEHLQIVERSDGLQKHITIKDAYRERFNSNTWKMELERLSLMGKRSWEKEIPEEYMRGTISQRLAIVQGLFDTDGYIDTQSSTSFMTTCEKLALQVQELIRSLGGIAKVVAKTKKYTYNNEVKVGRPAYQVNVRFKTPSLLFRMSRKKGRANDNNQYSAGLKLKIVSIEPTRVSEAVCISVDHPEKLFVAKDYIVTHNTITGIALSECLDTDITICIVPKNSVDRVWADTLEWVFKQKQPYWKSTSDEPLKKGYRYYVAHYEQLERILEFFKTGHEGKKINIILDESHNFNDLKSLRTELFLQLCKVVNCQDVLYSSGTPIKAMGSEVIPILRSIDPFFDAEAEERFKNIFGLSSARGLDILAHRLGYMTFKVDKAQIVGNTVEKFRVDVTLKNGEDYTLNVISHEMKQFVKERQAYYKNNMSKYVEQYMQGIRFYEHNCIKDRAHADEFYEYVRTAKLLHTSYDPYVHKQEPIFCNAFEKKYIIPALPKGMKETFKDARSVYKYVNLKVQGEALGRILGKKRTQCNVDMLSACESYQVTDMQTGEKFETSLVDIIDNSIKKTVVFTSYVEVVDKACEIFTKAGGFPLKVYGDTNSELPQIIATFDRDTRCNPLVATLQSLSTAVPLIMANTVVFLNSPFRAHEYEQACSRVDRLGQTEVVYIYDVYLNTGKEPNISSRSLDIMEWSRQQVEAMLGTSGSGSVALEDFDDVGEELKKLLPITGVQQTGEIRSLQPGCEGRYSW